MYIVGLLGHVILHAIVTYSIVNTVSFIVDRLQIRFFMPSYSSAFIIYGYIFVQIQLGLNLPEYVLRDITPKNRASLNSFSISSLIKLYLIL